MRLSGVATSEAPAHAALLRCFRHTHSARRSDRTPSASGSTANGDPPLPGRRRATIARGAQPGRDPGHRIRTLHAAARQPAPPMRRWKRSSTRLPTRLARQVSRTMPVFVERESQLQLVATEQILASFKRQASAATIRKLLDGLGLTIVGTSEFDPSRKILVPTVCAAGVAIARSGEPARGGRRRRGVCRAEFSRRDAQGDAERPTVRRRSGISTTAASGTARRSTTCARSARGSTGAAASARSSSPSSMTGSI